MDNKYFKYKRAIDYLPDEPKEAIKDTLGQYYVEHTIKEMHEWFYMSISHECSTYQSIDERARFIRFYKDLLKFIEATYAVEDKEDPTNTEGPQYVWQHITTKEVNDPMMIIRRFYCHYPLLYIRIELWDFFQAVQFYKGELKDAIYQYDTSGLYLHLLTLVEAFYLIVVVKPS